jgi:hypothetical protein
VYDECGRGADKAVCVDDEKVASPLQLLVPLIWLEAKRIHS